MTQAAIEFRRDAIPIIAFGKHRENVLDKDTSALERPLPTTDFRVSNDMLPEVFAFVRCHDLLLTHYCRLNKKCSRFSFVTWTERSAIQEWEFRIASGLHAEIKT
jgi:hypothetical protein